MNAIIPTDIVEPQQFTTAGLGWTPWVPPLPKEEFTDRHWDGVVQPQRADFPYFALLARDPEVLKARTLTDQDIFYNTEGGLERAERELAAAAVSRVNGCVFCASVHARAAAQLSGRVEDIERLLAEGVSADLGERWNAIVRAAVALTLTPVEFDVTHVRDLRDVGFSGAEIFDLIHAAAFFNWANRLMLSLGQPEVRGG